MARTCASVPPRAEAFQKEHSRPHTDREPHERGDQATLIALISPVQAGGKVLPIIAEEIPGLVAQSFLYFGRESPSIDHGYRLWFCRAAGTGGVAMKYKCLVGSSLGCCSDWRAYSSRNSSFGARRDHQRHRGASVRRRRVFVFFGDGYIRLGQNQHSLLSR